MRWAIALAFVAGLALAQPKPPNVTATNGSFSTITTTTANVGGTEKVAVLDAGVALINGQLQALGPIVGTSETLSTTLGVTGVTTLVALDAGVNSKVGGITIATAQAADGGVRSPLIQFGYAAMTTGAVTITFRTAFTSNPQCQCAHRNTTNSNPCVLDASTVPTTTAAKFLVASGGSDVIDWLCIGDQ